MLNSIRVIVALALIVIFSSASRGAAADLTCSTSTTLEGLSTCIRLQMPQSGSNGFVAPSAAEQDDWGTVVNQMLQGSCGFALPASLLGITRISNFSDSSNGRSYCVLMEVRDANGDGFVDRGWGTFVVYSGATRELSHQAPHPIADSTTELQAITIFKETESRSYLMAGAHRNANSTPSACQSSYNEADVAHNTANMFHATNRELMAFYGASAWNAIQWHGMAADTCPNTHVYASHGVNVLPTASDKISQLRDSLLVYHPLWDVDLAGAGACSLNATDNTQGRLLNGVAAASVCGTTAPGYSGRFIHIEQDPNYRNASDWVAPLEDTWRLSQPAAPTGLTATAGKKKITLKWKPSSGASAYNVKRRTSNNVNYSTIASGITSTTYTNTGLTTGATYYYVVSATNGGGESANSNQASAKAK